MTTITAVPHVLKDYKLVIDADNYEKAVSAVRFTPQTQQVTWTGPIGTAVSDTTVTGWTVQVDYAQDWETPASLSQYLLDHQGEQVSVEFVPVDAGTAKFTTDVTIVPGPIGGSTNQYATASVTLGCTEPVQAVHTPA